MRAQPGHEAPWNSPLSHLPHEIGKKSTPTKKPMDEAGNEDSRGRKRKRRKGSIAHPLEQAIDLLDWEKVQQILGEGQANPNRTNLDGDPLVFSILYRLRHLLDERKADSARRTLEALFKSDNVDKAVRDEFGLTILSKFIDTATNELAPVLAMWLEYPAIQALVDVKDDLGRSPLYIASTTNRLDLARLLIKAGAEINSKSNDGRTPLSYAAGQGATDVANELLACGAQPDSRDTKGRTPLSYAAERGAADVMKELVARRALVNSQDTDGRTPLSWYLRWCIQGGHTSDENSATLRLILASQHGPFEGNRKRAILALWTLRKSDKRNSGKIDRDMSIENLDPFHFVRLGFEDVIYLWLTVEKAGYKPMNPPTSLVLRKDSDQRTLLHVAAGLSSASIAAELLRNGAYIGAKDRQDDTPLKVAIQDGNQEVVELLLSHGAVVQGVITAQDWRRYMKLLRKAHCILVFSEEQPMEPQMLPVMPGQSNAKRLDTRPRRSKRSHDMIDRIEDASNADGARRLL